MFTEHVMDEVSHIQTRAIRRQTLPQRPIEFLKVPLGDRGQIPIRFDDGDDLSAREQIDPAGELAFGALGPFGDAPQHAVRSRKQAHRLRRF